MEVIPCLKGTLTPPNNYSSLNAGLAYALLVETNNCAMLVAICGLCTLNIPR